MSSLRELAAQRQQYYRECRQAQDARRDKSRVAYAAWKSGKHRITLVTDLTGAYTDGAWTGYSFYRGLHFLSGSPACRCPLICADMGGAKYMAAREESLFDSLRRSISDGNRCAFCELMFAAYDSGDEMIIAGFKGRSSLMVKPRVDIPIIPIDKYFGKTKLPVCLFKERPQWRTEKCSRCEYSNECYASKFMVHILEKPVNVDDLIADVICDDDYAKDGDISDPENSLIMKFTIRDTGRTEYGIVPTSDRINLVQAFKTQYDLDYYEMLKDTFPWKPEMFTPSHNYAEMLNKMTTSQQNCLAKWLDDEGIGLPEEDMTGTLGTADDKPAGEVVDHLAPVETAESGQGAAPYIMQGKTGTTSPAHHSGDSTQRAGDSTCKSGRRQNVRRGQRDAPPIGGTGKGFKCDDYPDRFDENDETCNSCKRFMKCQDEVEAAEMETLPEPHDTEPDPPATNPFTSYLNKK